MIAQGDPLVGVPNSNLLSILFAENHIKDSTVIWRDGQDERQSMTKGVARKLVRQIADGYVTAGLISNPPRSERDIFIFVSENQVIGYPNMLAIIAAGGIVATCSSQATVPELQFRINVLQPKAIICSTKSLPLATATLKSSPILFEIIIQDSKSMTIQSWQGHSYISKKEHLWSTKWNDEISNRSALLVFSSGTTGTPKGVCISQKNIIAMIFQLKHLFSPWLPSTPYPKMPGILDNAHVAGVFINTFSSLGLGIETFLIPGAEIDLLMQSIQRNKFDIVFAVPPVLERMLAHPKFPQTDFKSVKFMGTGAAKTTVETQKAISKALSPGTFCQMVWGMTELTFLATMHRPGIGGPWESIGQPLAGNAVKICDGNEIELGVEQAGEIYVSGPTVTSGYYHASVKEHEAKRGGWLRTGDIGKLDAEGYVYVIGRNKDLIKYNGAQVSPQELEEIIAKHNHVLEVGVVGTETADGNELPTAFVVLAEGSPEDVEQDIIRFTAEQVIPYKRLRGGVHKVPSIPRNHMGKTQHHLLRKLANEMYRSSRNKRLAKL